MQLYTKVDDPTNHDPVQQHTSTTENTSKRTTQSENLRQAQAAKNVDKTRREPAADDVLFILGTTFSLLI